MILGDKPLISEVVLSQCRLSSPIELSFVSTERSRFNPHESPSTCPRINNASVCSFLGIIRPLPDQFRQFSCIPLDAHSSRITSKFSKSTKPHHTSILVMSGGQRSTGSEPALPRNFHDHKIVKSGLG
jgi:hypothetical protein